MVAALPVLTGALKTLFYFLHVFLIRKNNEATGNEIYEDSRRDGSHCTRRYSNAYRKRKTDNLDEGASRVFDLVEEAQRAVDSGQLNRIHDIMLASAGIPGAFPFRMINDALYVDGGVTGNIVYGGHGGKMTAFRPFGRSPTRTYLFQRSVCG